MKKDTNSRITLYLTNKTIQKAKLMTAARGISFSQLVETLINENFTVEEIEEACEAAK